MLLEALNPPKVNTLKFDAVATVMLILATVPATKSCALNIGKYALLTDVFAPAPFKAEVGVVNAYVVPDLDPDAKYALINTTSPPLGATKVDPDAEADVIVKVNI